MAVTKVDISMLEDISAGAKVVAVAPSTSGNVLTSDGTNWTSAAAAGGGGSWNIIGTSVASASASLTVTGLDSTYDTYAIGISDLIPSTDIRILHLRMGDSSGIDSGGSDYQWHCQQSHSGSSGYGAAVDASDSEIQITSNVGSATGEGCGALLYLSRPGDGTIRPMIHGTWISNNDNANELQAGTVFGARLAVITLDRIQILFNSGNIASGRLTVWGIAHA